MKNKKKLLKSIYTHNFPKKKKNLINKCEENCKDKKIFICRICGLVNANDYFVLAKDAEEAKKIVAKHSPLMSNDIRCFTIDDVRKDMIKENNEIELL